MSLFSGSAAIDHFPLSFSIAEMQSPESPNDQIKKLQEILAENHRITQQTREVINELESKAAQAKEKKPGTNQSADGSASSKSQA